MWQISPDVPELMTPAEAADALGVTPTTVRRWADLGLLSHIRTAGGHRRYPRAEIQQALNTPPDTRR